MHTHRPAAVTAYHVQARRPGTGRILAVFTDGPADLAVAGYAADLAARTAAPIVAAAAVHSSGFSINPLLHRVRARRIADETAAITARVEPTLRRASPRLLVTTLTLPADQPAHPLPSSAVYRLAVRVGAATLVTAAPLDRPIRGLHPIHADSRTPITAATPPPAAATAG
jgi:hypothetical protein